MTDAPAHVAHMKEVLDKHGSLPWYAGLAYTHDPHLCFYWTGDSARKFTPDVLDSEIKSRTRVEGVYKTRIEDGNHVFDLKWDPKFVSAKAAVFVTSSAGYMRIDLPLYFTAKTTPVKFVHAATESLTISELYITNMRLTAAQQRASVDREHRFRNKYFEPIVLQTASEAVCEGSTGKKQKAVEIAADERCTTAIEAGQCPITFDLPINPVFAEDGVMYDRKAINQWFKRHKGPMRSPAHGTEMGTRLVPAPKQVTNMLRAIDPAYAERERLEHMEEEEVVIEDGLALYQGEEGESEKRLVCKEYAGNCDFVLRMLDKTMFVTGFTFSPFNYRLAEYGAYADGYEFDPMGDGPEYSNILGDITSHVSTHTTNALATVFYTGKPGSEVIDRLVAEYPVYSDSVFKGYLINSFKWDCTDRSLAVRARRQDEHGYACDKTVTIRHANGHLCRVMHQNTCADYYDGGKLAYHCKLLPNSDVVMYKYNNRPGDPPVVDWMRTYSGFYDALPDSIPENLHPLTLFLTEEKLYTHNAVMHTYFRDGKQTEIHTYNDICLFSIHYVVPKRTEYFSEDGRLTSVVNNGVTVSYAGAAGNERVVQLTSKDRKHTVCLEDVDKAFERGAVEHALISKYIAEEVD